MPPPADAPASLEIAALPAFADNYMWLLRMGDAAAVVDPGDAQPVLAYLSAHGLTLTAILNTHHHRDHVGGNAALLERFPVPVYGPDDGRIPAVTNVVGEGDRLPLPGFGGLAFDVLFLPGHTLTHIAFHAPGLLFCGDTLFACGCGYLFEGTAAQLHASLTRLAALPAATRVYCGHEYTEANLRFAHAVEPANPGIAAWQAEAGAQRAAARPTLPSTLGRESAVNPFLRCGVPAVKAAAEAHAGHALKDEVEVFAVLRAWKDGFRKPA